MIQFLIRLFTDNQREVTRLRALCIKQREFCARCPDDTKAAQWLHIYMESYEQAVIVGLRIARVAELWNQAGIIDIPL